MKKTTVKKVNNYAWLEGGLIGAALGVGAGLLVSSKLGKELGAKAKDLSADFYRYISPQIKKVKKMGEAEYKKFVQEAMAKYSKSKKLTEAEAKGLIKDAHGAWKHLKKNL